MQAVHTALAIGVLAATVASPQAAAAQDDGFAAQHAVFVMTNDADSNEILAYERLPNGTLLRAHRYETGGREAVERSTLWPLKAR